MSRKPPVGLRGVPRPASSDVNQALEQIGRRMERPNDDAAPVAARGVYKRVGRPRADGSRTGERLLRRVTVYLPLAVAHEAKLRAIRSDLSRVVSDTLAEAWGLSPEVEQ